MEDHLGQSSDILYKLIKMAWERNNASVREFFGNLAENDPDIKILFDRIEDRTDGNPIERKPETDEFVPPEADGGAGMDTDEWD